jgi:hypothetical protein
MIYSCNIDPTWIHHVISILHDFIKSILGDRAASLDPRVDKLTM